ncbi:MAG: GNAT family N-acetyltransferase [Clostridia bacterium]|nr:GNAT family N-acetyltransferase [Clostridia bacterium]
MEELKNGFACPGFELKTMGAESERELIEFNKLCFPKDFWREEDWDELLCDPRAVYFAAVTEDGVLAGNAFIYNWKGEHDYVKLMNLSVRPEYRGRGLAKALLLRMTEEAQTTGQKRVCGETRSTNTAMQRVFESCGFKLARVEADYYNDPPEAAYKYVWEE